VKFNKLFGYFKLKYVLIAFLPLTIFITFSISNVYYNALAGADNFKYMENLIFIFGESDSPFDSQGLLYFFIVSFFVKIRTESFDYINNPVFVTESLDSLFLSETILLANIFLFIFGLIGFFYLMKVLAFDENRIIFILLVFTYFPSFYYLRFNMKPEILAFALIPWIFYLFEDFLISKKSTNIFTMSILLAIMISSKGSIAGMVLLCLALKYINNYKLFNIRQVTLGFVILVISLLSISLENQVGDTGNLLQRRTEPQYDYRADVDIIYTVDFERLRKDPKKNYHKNSLISITIVDMFNDYFELNWKEDSTLLSKNIKPLIIERNLENNENLKFLNYDNQYKHFVYSGPHPNYLPYQMTYFGMVFSLVFIFLIFYYLIKESIENKIYILFPFMGVVVLLINSIYGFPQNNFDPNVADTLKVFYYVFLIPFPLAIILKNINFYRFKNILFAILFTVFSFINLGFPKINDEKFDQILTTSIENKLFCEFNKTFIEPTLVAGNYIQCKQFEPSGSIKTEFKNIPFSSLILFAMSIFHILLKIKKK
jgi:hypothetical protein